MIERLGQQRRLCIAAFNLDLPRQVARASRLSHTLHNGRQRPSERSRRHVAGEESDRGRKDSEQDQIAAHRTEKAEALI